MSGSYSFRAEVGGYTVSFYGWSGDSVRVEVTGPAGRPGGDPCPQLDAIIEAARLFREGGGGVYGLPPEIEAVIEEGRRHPERDQPRPRRAAGAGDGKAPPVPGEGGE